MIAAVAIGSTAIPAVAADTVSETPSVEVDEPPSTYTGPFVDDEGSVHEQDIAAVWLAGITRGCAEWMFCPADEVTRGEMAAFMARGFDLSAEEAAVVFVDLDHSPFGEEVAAIAAANITRGCAQRKFCPDDNLTRGEMAAFLRRALNLEDASKDWFGDDDDSIFEGDINAIAEAGLTSGCRPNQYCPDLQGPVTPMWGAGAHSTKKTNSTKNTTGTDNHLGPGTSSGTGAGFTDTVGHTFATDILWLAQTGITKGCNPPDNTRFCPNDPVTRGQMAAFLVRALKLPASGENAFEDTHSSVFSGDIAALDQAGITRGCNPPRNDRFCPERPVTRGEMAAFLRRALNG